MAPLEFDVAESSTPPVSQVSQSEPVHRRLMASSVPIRLDSARQSRFGIARPLRRNYIVLSPSTHIPSRPSSPPATACRCRVARAGSAPCRSGTVTPSTVHRQVLTRRPRFTVCDRRDALVLGGSTGFVGAEQPKLIHHLEWIPATVGRAGRDGCSGASGPSNLPVVGGADGTPSGGPLPPEAACRGAWSCRGTLPWHEDCAWGTR
jgi:hypothetical protein